MISIDQVCKMIVEMDTPFVRGYGKDGELIFIVEQEPTAESAADTVRNYLNAFNGYHRMKVKAANAAQKTQSYKGCFVYDVKVNEGTAPVQQMQQQNSTGSAFGMMTDFFKAMQMFQMISGNNNNADKQIEALRKEFEYQRQLDELRRQADDPLKYAALFGPTAMRVLGMKEEAIDKTLQQTAMSYSAINGNRNPGIAGTTSAAQTNTGKTLVTDMPTLEQLEKMTVEEKNQQIESAVSALAASIPAEHFLSILNHLKNKPELAADLQAITAVTPEKFSQLMKIIIRRPDMIDMAIQYGSKL